MPKRADKRITIQAVHRMGLIAHQYPSLWKNLSSKLLINHPSTVVELNRTTWGYSSEWCAAMLGILSFSLAAKSNKIRIQTSVLSVNQVMTLANLPTRHKPLSLSNP
jgi:hypothetical protein